MTLAVKLVTHSDALRLLLEVITQYRADLASAHAEICKLQGLDPEIFDWPSWTPQANTLRWLRKIEAEINEP